MCGIFSILNANNVTYNFINDEFIKDKNQVLQYSKLLQLDNNYFGFHRLAINGLNEKSNQPFNINNMILICNGEIYNF